MTPETDTTQKIGQGMALIAWVIFFSLVGLFFHDFLEEKKNPNRELKADSQQQVVLKRNRAGHYVAPGYLNGVKVTFLLDSGATWLSVPEGIAAKANLLKGSSAWVSTANGRIKVFQTTVQEVQLGGLRQQSVRALINPSEQGGVVLLGMNFLKEYRWEQSGDTLTLKVQ